MSQRGYFIGDYRVWHAGDQTFIERVSTGGQLPIYDGDVLQVAEMLLRMHNDRTRTADEQVRSTDEGDA